MGYKNIGLGAAFAALLALPVAHANAQTLMAQNTYNGPTVASQDSILTNNPTALDPQEQEIAQHNEVLAAETNLNLSAAVMHTQYHENIQQGFGDDESGITEGFGIGMSALLPRLLIWPNIDLYTALDYNFSAGNITYGGHYLFSGLPAKATDRAVFNRIEARFGLGFPLLGGVEAIPFIAGGYQAWNRNIDLKGQIGTDEFYDAALIGAGFKIDGPVTPALVLSGTAEILAVVAGNVSFNDINVNHGLGGSAEERLSLGADYDIRGPFHAFATADWEHFNYAGNKPTPNTYYFYEPLSTTSQFGANLGVAYSF